MKLLNRKPTEEMIRAAAVLMHNNKYHCISEMFAVMYDAAPELTVDMEPVAVCMKVGDKPLCTLMFVWAAGLVREEGMKLYSQNQLAALQAENGRLIFKLNSSEKDLMASNLKVAKLAAERDELLKAIQNVKDVKGRHHTEQAMLALFMLLGKES